jgi:hypothetical protein
MGIFKLGKSRKKGINEDDYDDSPGLLEKNSNSATSGNTVDSFADFNQDFSPVKKGKSTKRSKAGKVVEEWTKNGSTGNIDSLGDDFYNDPNMNFDSGGFDDMSADVSYLNDDITAIVDDDESRCSTYLDEDDAGNNNQAELMSPMAVLRKKQQAKKKAKDLQKKIVKKNMLSTLDEDDSNDEDDDSSRGETSDDASSSSAEDHEYESFFAYLDKEKTEEKKQKSGKKKKKKKDKKKKGKKKKKGDSSASNLNDSVSDLLNMVSPDVSERNVEEAELVNSSPDKEKTPTPADLEIAKHGNANVASAARRAIRRSSLGKDNFQPAPERKSRFDQILEGGDRPRYRRRSLNTKLTQSEIEEIEEQK